MKRWLPIIAVALIYIGCAKLGLALAFRAAQVTARDAGFDHHLLKPVEPVRLFELLR